MTNFGWSLPPGCTDRHIEEAYGIEINCPYCLVEDEGCTEEEVAKMDPEDLVLCDYHAKENGNA